MSTSKSFLYVTRNWASHEHADYAMYASVNLTAQYINSIFKWRDLLLPLTEKEKSIEELRICDDSADYHDSCPDLSSAILPSGEEDESAEEIFEDNGFVVVTADSVKLPESVRVSGSVIAVRKTGVEWVTSPKHGYYSVHTGQISYEQLEEVQKLL